MNVEKRNFYYKKLAKRSGVIPLYLYLVLIIPAFIAQFCILYIKFIPAMFLPLQKTTPQATLELVEQGFRNVIIELSAWPILLVIMTIALIKLTSDIKNFLKTFDEDSFKNQE